MNNPKQQNGFGIVEGVLAVAVVVIIGGVGWIAYNNFVKSDTATTDVHDTSEISDHRDMAMPKVETVDDLDKVSESLDDPSFDDDGAKEIDIQAGDF